MTIKTDNNSLPADSDIWTIIKTDYFGKNYANFRGRESRREYWISFVCEILLSFIPILGLLFTIPNFAITIRRLHDINKSGWWLLLYIGIPVSSYIFNGYPSSSLC